MIHDEFNEPVVPEPEPSGWEALGIPLWVVIAAGAGLLVFAIVLTIIAIVSILLQPALDQQRRDLHVLVHVVPDALAQLHAPFAPWESTPRTAPTPTWMPF